MDTSYATAIAQATIRVHCVSLRQQHLLQLLQPPPRDKLNESGAKRREIDVMEASDVTRTRCSTSRSTRATRWVTYQSRSACRRRAAELEDSAVLAAHHRPANSISSPTAKIFTSGTLYLAPSSTARKTNSLTNNLPCCIFVRSKCVNSRLL